MQTPAPLHFTTQLARSLLQIAQYDCAIIERPLPVLKLPANDIAPEAAKNATVANITNTLRIAQPRSQPNSSTTSGGALPYKGYAASAQNQKSNLKISGPI
jgi:hypothetical protein